MRGPPAGHPGTVWAALPGGDMSGQEHQLGVPEEAREDDPIPDALPEVEQDPGVDRDWEEAKDDPMGGASPSS